MLLLFVVCWIFMKLITIVHSAPKLGNILYDPIRPSRVNIESKQVFDDSQFSDGYLSDDLIVPYLRSEDQKSPGETAFEGYIFDPTICRHIHGRMLCGYNKNIWDNNEGKSVDLGNGCHMRGDRIECGYRLDEFEHQPANLRAIQTSETIASPDIKPEQTVTVKQLIRSHDTSENTETTILPRKSSGSVTSESTTIKTKILSSMIPEEIITDPPLARSSNTGGTDTTILPTKVAELVISTSSALNESLTIVSSSSTTTTRMEITPDTYIAPTKLSRRSLDDTKMVTGIINLNKTVANKSTALEVQKNESVQREYGDVSKSLQNPTVASEIIPISTVSYSDNVEQSSESVLVVSVTNASAAVIIPNIRNKPLGNSKTTTTNIKKLRMNSDKTVIKTVCVEQKDRIVCYDYKTI